MKTVSIQDISVSNNAPLTLIAGPCQLESRDHALMMAERIARAAESAGLKWIFKSSYDKANRSSISGARGMGMDEGLSVLAEVRDQFAVPVLTDVHDAAQCAPVADVVDVIQIPAFLCRQTDLLLAAGRTGAAINVKKGQFLAPWEMENVAAKIASTGNERLMLCERGASFGYNMLVSDMRSLPIMAQSGYPVIFDATHSVQLPGGMGASSGGQREFVEPLARAAAAVGCAGVFIETHDDPDQAPCDGPNMVPVDRLAVLLQGLAALDSLTKGRG